MQSLNELVVELACTTAIIIFDVYKKISQGKNKIKFGIKFSMVKFKSLIMKQFAILCVFNFVVIISAL